MANCPICNNSNTERKNPKAAALQWTCNACGWHFNPRPTKPTSPTKDAGPIERIVRQNDALWTVLTSTDDAERRAAFAVAFGKEPDEPQNAAKEETCTA